VRYQAAILTAVSATAEALALRCEGCGAELQLTAGLRTAKCPYCASPAVVERPVDPSRPDPTFVVGFVVTKEAALGHARRWIRRPLFAPSEFRRADVSEVRGIYVPAYLYTAAARAEYAAEIGENYTVVETYTTTDSKGRTVTRTRTRTVTEWRDLSGTWAAYVDDVLVTASRGLANAELARIEPFDLRALRRYSPKILSGWIAEDPSLQRDTCTTQARQEALESVGARLGRHMPGDKHRGLQHRTSLSHEDLELVLLPVWVLAVRYSKEKPPVRLVVNGQTGELFGKSPLSWPKIAITVLVVVAAIVGVVWLSS
jgi:hypothetical protein